MRATIQPSTAATPALPILVPCPNPVCGKVHRIKPRYAGMRGRCPACSAWMYVPRYQIRGKPPEPASPVVPTVRLKTRFGKAAAFWLMLGMLALSVLAASPWLRGMQLQARGPAAAILGESSVLDAIVPDRVPVVVGVPLGLLLLPALALLVGWFCRATNLLSRAFTYVATLAATGVALIVLHYAVHQYRAWKSLQQQVALMSDSELFLSWGPQLPVALLASFLAVSAFLLATFALHRRWWSRIMVVLLLGLPWVSSSLWLLRSLWLS